MTTARAPIDTVDLADRSLYQSGIPHEVFADLRAAGPVHRHRTETSSGGELEFWSLVRHREVQRASRDIDTFSAADGPGIEPSSLYRDSGMIVALDPPEHARLRRLISSGFTPRMVSRLEADIAARAERILDQVVAEGNDLIDFVSEIAFPLPMHVIADIVGIPEKDRAWVFSRTDQLLKAFDPAGGVSASDQQTPQIELYEYAHRLSEHKRSHPTDDVWSILTQTDLPGDDGETWSLSGVELDAFFMILTVAGSETTRNALSQGLMELVRHPEQMEAIRTDPSLLPGAAEEVLRWSSPVLMFGRTATRDVELGGRQISAGDRLVLWYPSANRDEEVFADPFRFDIGRHPNPHVAFGGGGAHHCLGANLAKKEIQVMLAALVERFSLLEVVGEARWAGAGPAHNVGVSVESLPVRLRAR